MQLVWRIAVVVIVLGAVAFAASFGVSRYLVSKLDGQGSPIQNTNLLQYASEEGYQFLYPDRYELSSRTEGNAEREWDVLVLLPKGYTPPQNGEGPPSISISVFPNPEGFSVDQWVMGDMRSNFKLSASQDLAPTEIDGERALFYQYSGLYETDAYAVAHEGKIFLFAGGWMGENDPIRTHFQQLVGTVQFTI